MFVLFLFILLAKPAFVNAIDLLDFHGSKSQAERYSFEQDTRSPCDNIRTIKTAPPSVINRLRDILSSPYPQNLPPPLWQEIKTYLEEHQWVKVAGNKITPSHIKQEYFQDIIHMVTINQGPKYVPWKFVCGEKFMPPRLNSLLLKTDLYTGLGIRDIIEKTIQTHFCKNKFKPKRALPPLEEEDQEIAADILQKIHSQKEEQYSFLIMLMKYHLNYKTNYFLSYKDKSYSPFSFFKRKHENDIWDLIEKKISKKTIKKTSLFYRAFEIRKTLPEQKTKKGKNIKKPKKKELQNIPCIKCAQKIFEFIPQCVTFNAHSKHKTPKREEKSFEHILFSRINAKKENLLSENKPEKQKIFYNYFNQNRLFQEALNALFSECEKDNEMNTEEKISKEQRDSLKNLLKILGGEKLKGKLKEKLTGTHLQKRPPTNESCYPS